MFFSYSGRLRGGKGGKNEKRKERNCLQICVFTYDPTDSEAPSLFCFLPIFIWERWCLWRHRYASRPCVASPFRRDDRNAIGVDRIFFFIVLLLHPPNNLGNLKYCIIRFAKKKSSPPHPLPFKSALLFFHSFSFMGRIFSNLIFFPPTIGFLSSGGFFWRGSRPSTCHGLKISAEKGGKARRDGFLYTPLPFTLEKRQRGLFLWEIMQKEALFIIHKNIILGSMKAK